MNAYDKENPTMKKSVVVFLDILGFSEMVKESFREGKGNDVLKSLHEVLEKSREYIKPESTALWELKVFTDNVVIGWPIHDDGERELGFTFLNLAAYQLALALRGFFVRGGICIGDHFMDEQIVFGPALIEAHEIESVKARDPRIVLSEEACKMVKSHIGYYSEPIESPQSNELLVDVDGQWFINYLSAGLTEPDDPSPTIEILKRHKEQVVLKLEKYKNNPTIWSKYAWVARYHNYFCNKYFTSSKELLISTNVLLLKPISLTEIDLA